MFDEVGNLYVLEHDHIIMNHSGGRNFAYQVEPSYLETNEQEKAKNTMNLEKYDKGLKIDPIGNNYLVVKNKLHLS